MYVVKSMCSDLETHCVSKMPLKKCFALFGVLSGLGYNRVVIVSTVAIATGSYSSEWHLTCLKWD